MTAPAPGHLVWCPACLTTAPPCCVCGGAGCCTEPEAAEFEGELWAELARPLCTPFDVPVELIE